MATRRRRGPKARAPKERARFVDRSQTGLELLLQVLADVKQKAPSDLFDELIRELVTTTLGVLHRHGALPSMPTPNGAA
jgi:hypothetical protein